MFSFVSRLIRRYRGCPELGWGAFEVLDQPHRHVLAHTCTQDEAVLLALHNFSAEPVQVPIALKAATDGAVLVDLLDDGETRLGGDGAVELALDGYGYRWLRLVRPGDVHLS